MTTNTPQDWGYLLGQIDGKLNGIQSLLGSIVQRADDHEARIKSLEIESAKARGGWNLGGKLWTMMIGILTVAAASAGWIAKSETTPAVAPTYIVQHATAHG